MKSIASLVNVVLIENNKNRDGVFQQNRLLCLILVVPSRHSSNIDNARYNISYWTGRVRFAYIALG